MADFIHDDFLLRSPAARRLYHEHACGLPIIDYHCHLNPAELAADCTFDDLTQIWITPDPYKHRAMRIAGVPEGVITGDASPREKFDRYAAAVPQTLGNPLFHWTALELKRYFNISELLSPDNASRIWDACTARLRSPGFSARGLLQAANVECVCTSDRLLDDLAHHRRLAGMGLAMRVLPSLRADDLLAMEPAAFPQYVAQLGLATHRTVKGFDDFKAAVAQRLDLFDSLGCRLADHGLDDFAYETVSEPDTAMLFERFLRDATLPARQTLQLKSGILRLLGIEYARRGWILQLHLGAQRRTSSRLRTLAGPAGGYACIGSSVDVPSVCRLLDDLEIQGSLPRTILYPLNPADFSAIAVLTGSFADDGVPGKIQFGPAWWYNDQQAGIRRHLDDLAHYGLLWTFIGMTTDSRSLLSMVRHEYFRRVFCDYLGEKVQAGEYPDDDALLAPLVRNVCYQNAYDALLTEKNARRQGGT